MSRIYYCQIILLFITVKVIFECLIAYITNTYMKSTDY